MRNNNPTTDKEKFPFPSRYIKNQLLNRTFKLFPELKSKYFLSIGCGAGEELQLLDKLGMEGEAVDISKDAVKIAKKRISENINIFEKDFNNLHKKYDLIIILDVLEHIEDDQSALLKINKLLNDSGYLLINVPKGSKLFGPSDEFYGHYRRYDKQQLEKLLSNTGFVKLMMWAYGPKWLHQLADLLMFRKKSQDSTLEKTKKSNVKTTPLMKWIYPLISKCYPYMVPKKQNSNGGTNYLVLCQKNKSMRKIP